MNFQDFVRSFSNYPLIKSAYFGLVGNEKYLQRQVSEWCKKGWLIVLRKGHYLINNPLYLERVNKFSLSNSLYEPSYVSLESALSFYGLIPEAVPSVSAITTRKTKSIDTPLGVFNYRSIHPKLFWGFDSKNISGNAVAMANAEKALLDLLYLRLGEFDTATDLVESLRLQNLDNIQLMRLNHFAQRFGSREIVLLCSQLSAI